MLFFELFIVLALIIFLSAVLKIHPVPVLLGAGLLWGILIKMGVAESLTVLADGFGAMMGKVGLIILAGTVIGVFMEERGALALLADRIVRVTGEKRIPTALSAIGYLSSIAIFCDSAFVILQGLASNLCRRGRVPLAVGIGALGLGLLSTHCLVPPAPGPVATATVLGADVGLTILLGLFVAFVTATAARLCAQKFCGSIRTAEELSRDERQRAEQPEEELSPVPFGTMRAALPILVPLLMIITGSIILFNLSETWKTAHPSWTRFLELIHMPTAALTIGACLAIFGLGKARLAELSVGGLLGKAITRATNILVITSAGGAFGRVLQQSELFNGMADFSGLGPWAICLPIAVAAVMKTAQGSSVVAALTTAGIVAPMLDPLGLGSPLYRALSVSAIGCGSMLVCHVNDSYFWVVSQFCGFEIRQGLRVLSVCSLVAGVTGSIFVVILSFIFRLF